MTTEEAYEVLKVSSSAGEAEVKKAYRKLALKHHPDKNPNDREEANKQFLRISEAYKRITEPESFKDEDDEGEMASEEEMNAMFNMMMAEMFGGMGGMGGMEGLFGRAMGGMPGMGGSKYEEDSDDEDDIMFTNMGGMGGFMAQAMMAEMMMGGGGPMGGGGMAEVMGSMGAGGGMGPDMDELMELVAMGAIDEEELEILLSGGGGVRGQRERGTKAPGRGVPRDPYTYMHASAGGRDSHRDRDEEEEEEEWETVSDDSNEQGAASDSGDDDAYGENTYFDEDMIKFLMSGVPQGSAGRATSVRSERADPEPPMNPGKNAKKNARRNAKKKEQRQRQEYLDRAMGTHQGPYDDQDLAEMMTKGMSELRGLDAVFQSTHLNSSSEKSSRKAGQSEDSATYKIGDTVMVAGGQMGKVAFLGEVEYSRGIFAGLVMPSGHGKNDGMVKGVRYFTCPKGCGLMLKTRDIVKKV